MDHMDHRSEIGRCQLTRKEPVARLPGPHWPGSVSARSGSNFRISAIWTTPREMNGSTYHRKYHVLSSVYRTRNDDHLYPLSNVLHWKSGCTSWWNARCQISPPEVFSVIQKYERHESCSYTLRVCGTWHLRNCQSCVHVQLSCFSRRTWHAWTQRWAALKGNLKR